MDTFRTIPVRRTRRRVSHLTRHQTTLHAPNRIGTKSVPQVLQEMAHFFAHIPGVNAFRKKGLTPEELEPRVLMTATISDLLNPTAATNVAIHSGNWSDASTWQNGAIPTAGAKVYIPQGVSVLFDAGTTPSLKWIRDDGALTFADTKNESLLVESIFVSNTGSFDIGTANNPFVHNATITFADNGPLNLTIDPGQVERGLVSQGHFAVYGQPIISFAPTATNPLAGDTTITVASSLNWHVGDTILLTGTVPGAHEDEEVKIAAITQVGDKTILTLDRPLLYDHTAPDGYSAYVADESRTVTFTSQNTTDSTRFGYMMWNVSADVTMQYAAITHMGRTDKSQLIDGVTNYDQDDGYIPGGGTNVPDRYGLFICRVGTDPSVPPIQIVGNFLTDSPGWGFVNRSSNVDFIDNVSYNVVGAGFATVTGAEIGSFTHNLAVYEKGAPDIAFDQRERLADWGYSGEGFSLASGAVDVVNNVSCGAAAEAYEIVGLHIVDGSHGDAMVPVATLNDPSWVPALLQAYPWMGSADGTKIFADLVPFHNFSGDEAFACGTGMGSYSFRPIVTDLGPNVIDNFTVWGVSRVGLDLAYIDNITVKNLTLLNFGGMPLTGIQMSHTATNSTFDNCDVEGWWYGLTLAEVGNTVVSGGYWHNEIDISIPNGMPDFGATDITRTVAINGATFGSDPNEIWVDYHLDVNGFGVDNFLASQGSVTMDGQNVYAAEQAPDYVPFPTLADLPAGYPKTWIGKTNQQLMGLYGVAAGNAVAPDSAASFDNIGGLVGA
jgi:hypothetical protein